MKLRPRATGVLALGFLAVSAAILAFHHAAGAGAPGERPEGAIDLPDGSIVYGAAPAGSPGSGRALYRSDDEGTRPITFDGQDDSRPALLADGRILFERRWLYPDPSRPPVFMTIHPDGTQIALFRDGSDRGAPLAAPPRPAPPNLTSTVDPLRRTGTILCLSAYASRLATVARLPRGAIHKVVVRRAGGGPGEVLAEGSVESDGSFFLEVPADTPLALTLLDQEGHALASLDSGIWVRPGENRGCIGCHEEPDRAPDNRRPLVLSKGGYRAP